MKRPCIIEFSGLPNLGKTTLLHRVNSLCESEHINALFVQEPAEILPSEIPKGAIAQNLWITLETLQRNLESIYQNDADCILLDRGFYNQLFWATMYSEKDLRYSDFVIHFMHELDEMYNIKPDYLYVVDVDVTEAIRRRMANGGNVTFSKKDFLISYKAKFQEFYEKINPRFYIDTTHLTKDQVAYSVFEQIKKIM